jgi:ribosomal protein L6P/L9E
MVIHYPINLVKIDDGILIFVARNPDLEIKSVRMPIPPGIRVSIASYGVEINGSDNAVVGDWGDYVRRYVERLK